MVLRPEMKKPDEFDDGLYKRVFKEFVEKKEKLIRDKTVIHQRLKRKFNKTIQPKDESNRGDYNDESEEEIEEQDKEDKKEDSQNTKQDGKKEY